MSEDQIAMVLLERFALFFKTPSSVNPPEARTKAGLGELQSEYFPA
jgi:hypothetical protein